jgi:hypothetical protein
MRPGPIGVVLQAPKKPIGLPSGNQVKKPGGDIEEVIDDEESVEEDPDPKMIEDEDIPSLPTGSGKTSFPELCDAVMALPDPVWTTEGGGDAARAAFAARGRQNAFVERVKMKTIRDPTGWVNIVGYAHDATTNEGQHDKATASASTANATTGASIFAPVADAAVGGLVAAGESLWPPGVSLVISGARLAAQTKYIHDLEKELKRGLKAGGFSTAANKVIGCYLRKTKVDRWVGIVTTSITTTANATIAPTFGASKILASGINFVLGTVHKIWGMKKDKQCAALQKAVDEENKFWDVIEAPETMNAVASGQCTQAPK